MLWPRMYQLCSTALSTCGGSSYHRPISAPLNDVGTFAALGACTKLLRGSLAPYIDFLRAAPTVDLVGNGGPGCSAPRSSGAPGRNAAPGLQPSDIFLDHIRGLAGPNVAVRFDAASD